MKNLLLLFFILLSLPTFAQQSRTDSIALSDKLYDEGVFFYHDKKYDKAAKIFEQLRTIDEQLYDSLDQRHFYASDWLASCYGKMGRTAEAIELSSDFELPPVERWGREVIDSLSYLAMQHFDAGSIEDALFYLREVVRMERDWNGEKATTYAGALNFLSYVLSSGGYSEQAEVTSRECLKVLSQHLKKDSYTYATYHYTLVETLVGMKRFDEALDIIRGLEPIYEKYGDDKSKNYLSLLFVKMYALYWKGGVDELEATASKLLRGCEKAGLVNNYMYGTALGMMGETANIKGDGQKGMELLKKADEALTVCEDEDPNLHPHYLSLLAQMYAAAGNGNEAKAYAEKGLDLCRGTMVGGPIYNQLLMLKGAAAINLNDKYRGLTWVDQAIEGYRKIGQVDHLLVDGLNAMSSYYRSVNNHQKDIEYSRLLLDTYMSMPDVEDTIVVASMLNLAQSLIAYTELDSAKVMTKQAVDFAEKKIPGTLSMGSVYYLAAQLTINMAMIDQSIDYVKKAAEIFEQYHADQYLFSAKAMLALAYAAKNDYVNAVEQQTNVLEYVKRTFGENSMEYGDAAQSLAQYQLSLGDMQGAGQTMEKAQAVFNDYHANADNYNALERLQLGNEFLARGDPYTADIVFLQALELMDKDSLQQTVNYASALLGLAQSEVGMGHWKPAYDYACQGVDIMEKIFGHEKAVANSAQLYSLRGQLLLMLGRSAEAYEELREVEQAIARFVSTDHMAYLQAGWQVCNAAIADNRKEVAVEYAEKLSGLLREYILSKFTTMSPQERMGTWNQNAAFYENVLPAMTNRYNDDIEVAGRLADCAYDGQLLGKGLLLTTEIEMNRLLLESGDQQAIEAYNQLKQKRSLLDQQTAIPKGQRSVNTDSLRLELTRLERQLTSMSTAYGDYTKPLRTTWLDVQKSLDKKDVAIEFVSFFLDEVTDMNQRQYAALILKKDMGHPVLVPLCSEQQLQDISAEGCYNTDSLAKLVWQPMAEYLNGAHRVFFSPTVSLHNIAVEYAPVEGGVTFAEKYDTYRLSSTREVVTASTTEKMKSARLFGGLQYNAKADEVSQANREAGLLSEGPLMASRAPVDSLMMRGGAGYLAYTLKEVDDITAELKGKISDVKPLTGVSGTEEAFKNLSGKHTDILHIATHGFFWTEEQANRMGNLAFLTVTNENAASEEDKALSRSGLLFAGANATLTHKQVPDNLEDGILTARELSQLDLRGTSLVVLSACQTALGKVTGDGVFGLQRGFKKAGAKTMVMSLWKVDDQATQILMTAFYHHLVDGQSPRSAFLAAQQHLRHIENGRFNAPIYWAAFILLDAMEK